MRLVHPQRMNLQQRHAWHLCASHVSIAPTIDEVRAVIAEQIESLGGGLRILDERLPIGDAGEVDAVAIDAAGQLHFIAVHKRLDAQGMSHSFLQQDWACANLRLLAHLYRHDKPELSPQIWHVTETVTAEARAILMRVRTPGIAVFTYTAVELQGEPWLVVDRLGDGGAPKGEGALMPEMAAPQRVMRSVLTEEEIADFFRPTPEGFVDEDDVTEIAHASAFD